MANQTAAKSTPKQMIIAVFILLVLGALVGLLIWGIVRVLQTFDKSVSAAIIASIATVLVSVSSLIGSRYFDRKREIEQEHRKQKQPIYEEFMQVLFKLFLGSKPGMVPVSQGELTASLSGFTQKLIIWGSDEVIREFAAFRRQTMVLAANQGNIPEMVKSFIAFEKLLYAIRVDMGHKNKDLKQGDVLALFINDFDQYLAPEKAETEQTSQAVSAGTASNPADNDQAQHG